MTTTFSPVASAPDHIADYSNAFLTGRRLGAPEGGDCAPLDPVQRRAELFAALGLALLGHRYEARRAILAHLAPALAKEGLPHAVIAQFDPTDAAIEASVERARALGAACQAGEGA